jgi:hypothetical protein
MLNLCGIVAAIPVINGRFGRLHNR